MVKDYIADIQHCDDKLFEHANYFCARLGHLPMLVKRELFQNFFYLCTVFSCGILIIKVNTNLQLHNVKQPSVSANYRQ